MIGSEICAKDTKNVRLADILFTVFPLENMHFVVKTRIEKHAFAKDGSMKNLIFFKSGLFNLSYLQGMVVFKNDRWASH